MRAPLRLLVAALAATALCAALAATAGANRIRISSNQLRHVWPSWTVSSAAGEIRMTCPITLEGSLHQSTIAKTVGTLLGYITRPAVNTAACTGGTPVLLAASLPWHLRYNTFFGTLPLITAFRIDLVGIAFLWTILGQSCLYQSTSAAPAHWITSLERSGGVTGVRWDETSRIPLRSGPFLCPATVTFSGTGTLTHSGTETRTSITLI